MKKLILIAAITITGLASCTSNKTYTFKSTKTDFTYEDSNYQNLNNHKIGDTVIMPMYLGNPDNFKTVDVVLIAIN